MGISGGGGAVRNKLVCGGKEHQDGAGGNLGAEPILAGRDFPCSVAGNALPGPTAVNFGSSPVPGPPAVHGVSEAAALAGEDHNVEAMDQAVDQGGSQAVVIKNGVPPGNPPSSPCG